MRVSEPAAGVARQQLMGTPRVARRDSPAYDQILGKNEQLYQLLAIAVSMCPAAMRWVEDPVAEQLRAKAAGEMNRMATGDLEVFKRAFGTGCARFVTTDPPDIEGGVDNGRSGFQTQLRAFVAEVCEPQAPRFSCTPQTPGPVASCMPHALVLQRRTAAGAAAAQRAQRHPCCVCPKRAS